MSIKIVQQRLAAAGFNPGPIDGAWGPATERALFAAIPLSPAVPERHLVWGARVSDRFRRRVFEIAVDIGCSPDHLMACMAWESAETFRSDIRNAAGSGATGLIQFMPATARELGTTTDRLATLTPESQLDFVQRYFAPYRGRLRSLSDVYMAILWPAGIGKPEDHILWSKAKRPTTYHQNRGLDIDRDGDITKAEAAAKVTEKLARGALPGNLWVGA